MKKEIIETKRNIIYDDDFKNEFVKHHGYWDQKEFNKEIDQLLDYCFNSGEADPFLDKRYLDMCYLAITKYNKELIINLEIIWDEYTSF